jgi:transposase
MVVAIGLLVAIGPITRFERPDKLVAYLGLNPSVHQSGEVGRGMGGSPSKGALTLVPCLSKPHGRPCAASGGCGRSMNASPVVAAIPALSV